MILALLRRRYTIRRFLFALILVVACATGAAADPYEDALSALQRGDPKLAAWLLRPLAEQGNAQAQIKLGWMYERGQGVPQNDQEAVKWYRKAAQLGYAEAQSSLGAMYFEGKGVPQDNVRAYIWFDLAVQRYLRQGGKNMETTQRRDAIAKQLTSVQMAEAQRLAQQFERRIMQTVSPSPLTTKTYPGPNHHGVICPHGLLRFQSGIPS